MATTTRMRRATNAACTFTQRGVLPMEEASFFTTTLAPSSVRNKNEPNVF